MEWTRDAVRNEVLELFRRRVQPDVDVAPSSQLVADLGIDSLGVMEVIADVEDAFGLTIPDDALRDVDTIADVARAIETRLSDGGRLCG